MFNLKMLQIFNINLDKILYHIKILQDKKLSTFNTVTLEIFNQGVHVHVAVFH